MVVQLSSVDPLKIRELKAAAGKYAYSSRIKWLHIDDKIQVKSAILNQFGKNLDIIIDNFIGKYYR